MGGLLLDFPQAGCFYPHVRNELSAEAVLAFCMCLAQGPRVNSKGESRALQFLLSNRAAPFLAFTIKHGQCSWRDQQIVWKGHCTADLSLFLPFLYQIAAWRDGPWVRAAPMLRGPLSTLVFKIRCTNLAASLGATG